MTPHEYLAGVLAGQAMNPVALVTLQRLRGEIEGCLRQRFGAGPRMYYGGSYGKDTMIRAAYDLDIVVYFPPTERAPVGDIYTGVHSCLTAGRYIVQPTTVALRLPYEGGFHVDVVPGRAQDLTFRYATLYKNQSPPSTLQTSLKVHIDAVRKGGIRDAVRLMKLWRLRHSLQWKTLALEIVVARALYGLQKSDLGSCLWATFEYIAGNIRTTRLEDPANTNNVIEMSLEDRAGVAQAAAQSLQASNWNQIVW